MPSTSTAPHPQRDRREEEISDEERQHLEDRMRLLGYL